MYPHHVVFKRRKISFMKPFWNCPLSSHTSFVQPDQVTTLCINGHTVRLHTGWGAMNNGGFNNLILLLLSVSLQQLPLLQYILSASGLAICLSFTYTYTALYPHVDEQVLVCLPPSFPTTFCQIEFASMSYTGPPLGYKFKQTNMLP